MKNYLFAPFKNDKEKINAFNYLDKNLDHNELIIFIGRLESYYDRYITHLKAENEKLNAECWCGCNDDLKAEYNDMKAEINTLIKSNNKRVDMIKELKNQLATSIKDEDIIQAQGEEIKRLKADIRHDAKVSYTLDDKLLVEIESLQDQLKDAVNDYEELLNSASVK